MEHSSLVPSQFVRYDLFCFWQNESKYFPSSVTANNSVKKKLRKYSIVLEYLTKKENEVLLYSYDRFSIIG